MRHIDLETWSRRNHFMLFNGFDYPHFSMCANVDLTAFHPVLKQRGLSFTVAFVYVLARVANEIPEFRYRIRSGNVVEHDIVHPAITLLTGEDVFGFVWFDYAEEFSLFAAGAAQRIAAARESASVEYDPAQDDQLYMTAIPWVSFTSFMHPLPLSPPDSVPRFAWGRLFEESELLKMPLSVQAHHALMDGLHMGRYYERVQEYLHHPGKVLGEA